MSDVPPQVWEKIDQLQLRMGKAEGQIAMNRQTIDATQASASRIEQTQAEILQAIADLKEARDWQHGKHQGRRELAKDLIKWLGVAVAAASLMVATIKMMDERRAPVTGKPPSELKGVLRDQQEPRTGRGLDT